MLGQKKKNKCDKYSVILIPGKYGRARNFSIPRWLIATIMSVNIAFLAYVVCLFLNFQIAQNELINMESLQNNVQILTNDNEKKEDELNEYYNVEDEIKEKLQQIEELEKEIQDKMQSTNDLKNIEIAKLTYTEMNENLVNLTYSELPQVLDEKIQDLNNIMDDVNAIKRDNDRIPTLMPSIGTITSYFGTRSNPFSRGGTEFHSGVDIANSSGTKVVATADGYVAQASYHSGYGNLVVIDHKNGYVSYYGHNTSFAVSEGEWVEKGQLIAYMGSTGRSTGPHVHFEIRLNNTPINPINVLQGGI